MPASTSHCPISRTCRSSRLATCSCGLHCGAHCIFWPDRSVSLSFRITAITGGSRFSKHGSGFAPAGASSSTQYANEARHDGSPGALSKQFFLVSLQTATDSQIRVHSRFESMEPFIREVIASFSRHGPGSCALVFKHHPLDRGHVDYRRFIRRVCAEHGATGRVFYIHDQHLPTLLAHAAGLVVVNSTVGLSGIHHGLSVKALGDPVYDIEGLVFKGELDAFWQAAGSFVPDMALYRRFRRWLIDHTQLNGSFYVGDVECDMSRSSSRSDEPAVEAARLLAAHRHTAALPDSDGSSVGLSPEEEAA